ncbi:MAG TPA: hypothetical protein VHN19_10830 [Burkholderiales bacterium]|nr:hypothetical protein [Burkholderiales bacterium]
MARADAGVALRTKCLLLLLCAAFLGPARGQTPEETLAKAELAEPLLLMGAAVQLDRAGKKDEAVFWFYAGQLRARYSPLLKGENSQLVVIFTMSGEGINAHAQKDVPRMAKTIDRVLDWDEKTFAAWAKAQKLDPSDVKLAADRARTREGLVALMAELRSKREHYEKLAREYKDPEEQRRAALEEEARQIRANFSTRTVERVVDGHRLRLPANYFSRMGLKEPDRAEVRDLVLALFLPEMEGFSTATPVDLGGLRNLMWVRVNDPNMNRNAFELFEAFVASQPKTEPLFGSDAFFFDAFNNPGKFRLPLYGYTNEHVLALDRPGRDRAYVSCVAPERNITRTNPQCRLFMRHAASGLRVSAAFSQDYGNDWQRIIDRIHALLDTWHVRQP